MEKYILNVGDIVQLSPFDCRIKLLGGCFMVVTEPKPWGAQGYVQGLGKKTRNRLATHITAQTGKKWNLRAA